MLNCNENAFYGILVVIVGIFVFSSINDRQMWWICWIVWHCKENGKIRHLHAIVWICWKVSESALGCAGLLVMDGWLLLSRTCLDLDQESNTHDNRLSPTIKCGIEGVTHDTTYVVSCGTSSSTT